VISRTVTWYRPRRANSCSASRSSRSLVAVESRGTTARVSGYSWTSALSGMTVGHSTPSGSGWLNFAYFGFAVAR
jgi:hypothetical protein